MQEQHIGESQHVFGNAETRPGIQTEEVAV